MQHFAISIRRKVKGWVGCGRNIVVAGRGREGGDEIPKGNDHFMLFVPERPRIMCLIENEIRVILMTYAYEFLFPFRRQTATESSPRATGGHLLLASLLCWTPRGSRHWGWVYLQKECAKILHFTISSAHSRFCCCALPLGNVSHIRILNCCLHVWVPIWWLKSWCMTKLHKFFFNYCWKERKGRLEILLNVIIFPSRLPPRFQS